MKITLSKLSTKDLATLAQRTINTSDSGKYPVITAHPLLSDLKLKYRDYDLADTDELEKAAKNSNLPEPKNNPPQ